MRGAHGIRGDRANERRERTDFRRRRRTSTAIRDRGTVVGEGHIEQHNLSLRFRGARGEFVEASHDHHWCGDSALGRGNGTAEPEHGEVRHARLHERGRLLAAHPVRHHRRLGVHVVEPVLLHFGDQPVDAAFERGRSRQAIARVVGKAREGVPRRALVSHCGRDHPLGRRLVGNGDIRLSLRHEGDGEQRGAESKSEASAHDDTPRGREENAKRLEGGSLRRRFARSAISYVPRSERTSVPRFLRSHCYRRECPRGSGCHRASRSPPRASSGRCRTSRTRG